MDQPICPTCYGLGIPVSVETTADGGSMTLRCPAGHRFTVKIPRKKAT